jgi:hypothetical protein
MHIGKVLRLLGIAIASLALVMMTVSANSNSLSSSFALGKRKFTARVFKMIHENLGFQFRLFA